MNWTPNDAGRFKYEHHDCVVRALALFLGRPYADMHALCKANGRKNGRACQTADMLFAAGYRRAPVCCSGTWTNCPTVQKFIETHPTGRFFVQMRGHVFVVIDGVIHDTEAVSPRARVKKAWIFLAKGSRFVRASKT
jgi:hypothetical protein